MVADLLVLFGAGAMVDAGLPTAIGLTNRLRDYVEVYAPSLQPHLSFLEGAVQFGKACRGESLRAQPDIEEIVRSCEFLSSRDAHHVYPFVGAWHERVTALEYITSDPSDFGRSSFGTLVARCKEQLPQWLGISDVGSISYLMRLGDLVAAGYRLHLFTLNYDDGLEIALKAAVGEINLKWTTGFGDSGWRPRLFEEPGFQAYLYKLHGSIDWVRDPKLGICSVRWPAAVDSEELPSDYESLLIFGTDVKVQALDPFLTLLYLFQQRLRNAPFLVIIGYGFRDAHINGMIAEALQSDPRMKAIVVNPTDLSELLPQSSEFARLVGIEDRLRAIRSSAKDVLDTGELLKAIRALQEEQQEALPF